MRYRKKPVEVVAWRFEPVLSREGNWRHAPPPDWLAVRSDVVFTMDVDAAPVMLIETLEGRMRADRGDWIIQGTRGEVYPCKPNVFDDVYEPCPT